MSVKLRSAKTIFHSVLFWFGITLILYEIAIGLSFTGIEDSFDKTESLLFSEFKTLLLAFISSFAFYFLIVYLPNSRKQRVLRENCLKMYRDTKKQILFDILSASQQGGRTDIESSLDVVERLMVPTEFRKVFQHGSEANEGFYAFSNHIQRSEKDFRSIIFKFKLIARQLEYVLNNYEIKDQETFESIKRIEEILFELDILHVGYDDEKVLGRIIWAIFAGWSMVEEYRDYDIIEKAIAKI